MTGTSARPGGEREYRRLYSFSVWQDGMEVASGSGGDMEQVAAAAMHYAQIYAKDGPPVELRTVGFSFGPPLRKQ